MLAVALLTLVPPPFALSAEDYATREAEQARARSCGWLAVPRLSHLASGSDPEARFRALELLAPFRAAVTDRGALAAWVEPDTDPTDAALAKLHADPRARYRLAMACRRAGLLSDDDGRDLEAGRAPSWFSIIWNDAQPHDYTASAVTTVRARFRERNCYRERTEP